MKVCKEIVKEKKLYIVIALFSKCLHFYMRKLKKINKYYCVSVHVKQNSLDLTCLYQF